MSKKYLESESIPLIEGLKIMVQSGKIGVDLLHDLSHICDTNIMPIKICLIVLGYINY